MKISWDNLQALNLIVNKLSLERKERITQDTALRFLIDFYKRNSSE